MKKRIRIVHRSTPRTTKFADAVLSKIDQSSGKGWVIGTVTSTSPFNVEHLGEDLGPIGRLAGYTPTAGDTVLVAIGGQQATVLDKLA